MRGFWDIIGGIGDVIGGIGKAIGDAINQFFGGGASSGSSSSKSSKPSTPQTPKEAIQHLNQGLKQQQKSRTQKTSTSRSGASVSKPPSTPAVPRTSSTSTYSRTGRHRSGGGSHRSRSWWSPTNQGFSSKDTDIVDQLIEQAKQKEEMQRSLPEGKYVLLPSGKFMNVKTGKIVDAPPQGTSYAGQKYEIVGQVTERGYVNFGGHTPIDKQTAVTMYRHLARDAGVSPSAALEAVVKEGEDYGKAKTRPTHLTSDVHEFAMSGVMARAHANLIKFYNTELQNLSTAEREKVQQFQQKVAAYMAELEKYNQAVAAFNEKASKQVSPDVAKKLAKEREKLNRWREQLESKRAALEKEYKELNDFIEKTTQRINKIAWESVPAAAFSMGELLGKSKKLGKKSEAVHENLLIEAAATTYRKRVQGFSEIISGFGVPEGISKSIAEGLTDIAVAGTWSNVFRVPEITATLRGDKRAAELHFSKGLMELEEASKNFGKDWGKYLSWYLTSPGPSILEMYGAGLITGAAITKVASIPKVAAATSRFSRAVNIGGKLLNIGIGAAIAGDIIGTATKDIDVAAGKAVAYTALGTAFAGGVGAGAKWMEARLSKKIVKEPLEIRIKNAEYSPAEKKMVGEIQAKIGKHELFTSPFEAENVSIQEAIVGQAKSVRMKVTSYDTKLLGVQAKEGVAKWLGIQSRGAFPHSPYIETIKYSKPPGVSTEAFRSWLAKRIGRVGKVQSVRFAFAQASGPRGTLGYIKITPAEIQGSGDAIKAMFKVSRQTSVALFEGTGVAGKGLLTTVDIPTGIVGIKEVAKGARADIVNIGKRVFQVDSKFLEYRAGLWARGRAVRLQTIGRSASEIVGKRGNSRALLTYHADILDDVLKFRGAGLYKSKNVKFKLFVGGEAEISPFRAPKIEAPKTPSAEATSGSTTVATGGGTAQSMLAKAKMLVPRNITVPKITTAEGFSGLLSATAEQAAEILERGKSVFLQAIPKVPSVLKEIPKIRVGEKGTEKMELPFTVGAASLSSVARPKLKVPVVAKEIKVLRPKISAATVTRQAESQKSEVASLTNIKENIVETQGVGEVQIQKIRTAARTATATAVKPPAPPASISIKVPPIVVPSVRVTVPKFGWPPLGAQKVRRRPTEHTPRPRPRSKARYLWFVKPTLFAADAIKKMFGGVTKIPRSPEVTKAYVRWLKSGGYTEFNPWKIIKEEDKSSKRAVKKILSDKRKKRRRRR